MEHDERAGTGTQAAARPRSHLFTVRLWKQAVEGGWEYRGSVREVMSGANRSFRDWSELAAFMVERVEEGEPGHSATGTDKRESTTGRQR
jgi:hypothetical protein